MKSALFILGMLAFFPTQSWATVKFTGHDWKYGESTQEIIETIGIASNENGEVRVVLNLENDKQVILAGSHSALGLSLTPYQGQCVKIIPGKKLESVALILNCD